VRVRDLSKIRIDPITLPSAGGNIHGLFYHTAADRAATCVVLCHGYSASKHNVDILAFFLAVEGFTAFAIDFQGHKLGASSLPLVRAEDLLSNALDARRYVRSRTDVGRIVMAGHSMGAAVAIGATVRDADVSGTIVMCTALRRADRLGDGGLATGLRNRAAYVEGASPEAITAAMDGYTEQIGEVSPRPLLVVAARKDALVAPSAVRALFDVAHEPKTYELVDATHTDCAERARFVIVKWLRANGFE
jgi:pimeloyl-ACP methyl ester carboxylesterase